MNILKAGRYSKISLSRFNHSQKERGKLMVSTQHARIEARVSPQQKELFERAAEIHGVTLTDFAISTMHRAAFSSGKPPLGRDIQEQASQDIKRDLARVFVITAKDSNVVLAYYTLSVKELKLEQPPPETAKKAGKYGTVGVTLIGRLPVTEQCKGTAY
jgi:hypothetical protein